MQDHEVRWRDSDDTEYLQPLATKRQVYALLRRLERDGIRWVEVTLDNLSGERSIFQDFFQFFGPPSDVIITMKNPLRAVK